MSTYHDRPDEEEDKETQGGSDSGTNGTSDSGLQFVDFAGITGKPLRDDLLPPDEIKRLLVIAANGHKESVRKEKTKRDAIKAVKDNKLSVANYREQFGGAKNEYKTNPILANKAQFSGISPEVTPNPTDSKTNTNEGEKNELTNEYRLTHQLQYDARPRYTPQPKPPGY
jgi:hypothetical protein